MGQSGCDIFKKSTIPKKNSYQCRGVMKRSKLVILEGDEDRILDELESRMNSDDIDLLLGNDADENDYEYLQDEYPELSGWIDDLWQGAKGVVRGVTKGYRKRKSRQKSASIKKAQKKQINKLRSELEKTYKRKGAKGLYKTRRQLAAKKKPAPIINAVDSFIKEKKEPSYSQYIKKKSRKKTKGKTKGKTLRSGITGMTGNLTGLIAKNPMLLSVPIVIGIILLTRRPEPPRYNYNRR